MSVNISRKLSNSFEGALAGGGDPATSPLYVFGPFLHLIVAAGVAQVTFGATIWLAVITVFMVSAMYRQVMRWVTDGSGGSGLNEEEFGSWAVKISAGITVVEYTLAFLVSMAALVTFVADRFPEELNSTLLGIKYRVFLAAGLSIFTGWIVNRGPKISVRVFGPATGAVLLLLWVLIGAALFKVGLHLPNIDWQAFSLAEASDGKSYLHFTFAGYARVLALMTGIEVFANLVAAYSGTREERGSKAFGSLVIIMGTTVLSMLALGPVIFEHADPMNTHVCVFTQAMDFLLPPWASYIGTIVGVVVLLSACAAAAQGVQNLALGLRMRHYIPAQLGERNEYEVASLPVWIMSAFTAICFFVLGTHEDTYLALYAAGVFVLLSMTGWAAAKRLLREAKGRFSYMKAAYLSGTALAATMASAATVIIFHERFSEGAWLYLVIVPAFYVYFSINRRKFGAPASVQDWFGRVISSEGYVPQIWYDKLKRQEALIDRIVVPLSGSASSEQILPIARTLARSQGAHISLLSAIDDNDENKNSRTEYMQTVSASMQADGIGASYWIQSGDVAEAIDQHSSEIKADMIAMTSGTSSSISNVLSTGAIVDTVIKKALIPVLVARKSAEWRTRYSSFRNILVALDGSESAEAVLPYIRTIAQAFGSMVTLLFVAEGTEDEDYHKTIEEYLHGVVKTLREEFVDASPLFTGTDPARTIIEESRERKMDLIMMATHGRGGTVRPNIHIGSVTEQVIKEADCPVFVVPLTKLQ